MENLKLKVIKDSDNYTFIHYEEIEGGGLVFPRTKLEETWNKESVKNEFESTILRAKKLYEVLEKIDEVDGVPFVPPIDLNDDGIITPDEKEASWWGGFWSKVRTIWN